MAAGGGSPSHRPPTRQIGPDRVEVYPDRLIVTTPLRQIPGWAVRKYRAPIVRFENRTWRIIARSVDPDQRTRYTLVPWEPLDGELPGPEIDYSPDDVALREHADALGRRRSRVTLWLNYVGPLTGFLPARTKAHLEEVYGIDPAVSTRWSVFIEFLVVLGCLVLMSIGQMVRVYGYPSPFPLGLLFGAAVVVAIDAVMRWDRLLGEERPAPGFYEWLIRRAK